MNFPYFARQNPWVQFFKAPDNGGGTGGGGKPQTVPELTQKVTTLEADKQKLDGELAAEKQKVTALEAGKQKLDGELAAEKQKVTALEADKQKLDGELAAEKQKVTTLETDKQTVTKERDQFKVDASKAREEMAKAGITPPPSDAAKKEGEKQEGTEDKNLTPAQRLAKIIDGEKK